MKPLKLSGSFSKELFIKIQNKEEINMSKGKILTLCGVGLAAAATIATAIYLKYIVNKLYQDDYDFDDFDDDCCCNDCYGCDRSHCDDCW